MNIFDPEMKTYTSYTLINNEEIHKMALLSIQFIINMFWKLSFLTLIKNKWLLYLVLSFSWVLGTLPEFFMAFSIFNYLAS